MYHEAELFKPSYYDTYEEMPVTAKVYFPDEKEPKEMNEYQMMELSREGWMTVMHSCNFGVCDHWTSEPLETWVRKRFMKVFRYVDKDGKTVGYNRNGWSVKLTKEKVFKSAVWNS